MNYLEGIKVADLTAAVAGTSVTMVLADLGADEFEDEPLHIYFLQDPHV